MKKDLTQLQIPRLPEVFNLTDGHAHRSLTPSEAVIAQDILTDFFIIERERQQQLERVYAEEFYGLARQTINYEKTRYLFLPSASISLEIAGNFLRLKKYSLALTEPCFDGLANIFKRHDVSVTPIPDTAMEEENFGGVLDNLQVDAICVVSPNNPTGNSYTRANFELLVEHCKANGTLLILDTSFRMYRPDETIFDEYALLQQSGIDFIAIEDTGKTWPTKELKTSILAVSPAIYKEIFDIYTDFIYHHSPFILQLLTGFLKHSRKDKLTSVHQVVAANRTLLYEALKGSVLKPVGKPFSSVVWLEIAPSSGVTAQQVVSRFAQAGIFILPGTYFFWSDKSRGDGYVRISLVRDTALFERAVPVIRQVAAALTA